MNNKQQTREWIDRAVDWLDKMELWGMTLITKIIAAITPIPVSLQTRKHAQAYLGYETPWDWIIAIIVEFLGYAAIYKALQFAEHNRRYYDPKNKAPFKLAIATYVFYLVAVIVFNVIPECANKKEGYIVAMNIVLALFSVPGGVLAGISAIFTERKAALKRTSNTPANTKPNEQEAEQPEPNEHRTPNANTPSTERRTRTPNPPVPQPTNERRTFVPFPNTEQGEKRTRIEQYAEQLKANGITPSIRTIQRGLRIADFEANTGRKPTPEEEATLTGWSTSTISEVLKHFGILRNRFPVPGAVGTGEPGLYVSKGVSE